MALIILTFAAAFTTVSAAQTSSQDIAQVMESLGIMNGYPDGETYLLSSTVVVYEKIYSGYKIIPLSDLTENDGYSLAAYFDKSEANGGRIRVIIATK